jgi:hypothetical protein
MQVLTSDNGAIPAVTWAGIAAERIADTSHLSADRQIAGNKLKSELGAALFDVMHDAQVDERTALAANTDRLLVPFDINAMIGKVKAAILNATSATEWASHFASPAVLQAAWEVVAPLIATIIHIERLWHCDANPDSTQAVAYRAKQG